MLRFIFGFASRFMVAFVIFSAIALFAEQRAAFLTIEHLLMMGFAALIAACVWGVDWSEFHGG